MIRPDRATRGATAVVLGFSWPISHDGGGLTPATCCSWSARVFDRMVAAELALTSSAAQLVATVIDAVCGCG